MNQRSYVKAVAKRLTCSKARRDEFVRDLESDIAAALAEGETWEQVERRMGDPRDVAREFNEDLSDRELAAGKKRRRNKVVGIVSGAVVVVLVVLVVAAWWATPKTAPAGQSVGLSEQEVLAQAQKVVALVDAGDYEAIFALAPESLQQTMTSQEFADAIEEARATVGGGDWGSFTSFGNAYGVEIVQMGQTQEFTETMVVYENAVITYTITFDGSMQLTNLFMK
ncbi:HAAS signaling domain-containing protein [Gordonibacter massiliensis (ex Traore et al. 2017)]|uniref:HAAS signaling domain-containing protein n=1 Tax=Gordonibacter massiliensis (ex Traore et al. 2017) TaxID=1841863 RepID=UPI001C8B95AF|nr:DUF3887 domain-containing protein [Gordonibacter massiliensis (ex Traore et al. 2017)]MBX9033319.1 DUF3887 domain-containing protein [Gordonibacter massiliensis (ex Traore et al. 2017)]